LIACAQDPGSAALAEAASARGARTLSYGIRQPGEPAGRYDLEAFDLALNEQGGFSFQVQRGAAIYPVQLQVTGQHNVHNALAALAVAAELGQDMQEAAAALGAFQGTGRRFELRGQAGGVTVIDDYAHHPTEVRATLSAARERYPGRRIWAVWQPHTYSRSRTLLAGFATAFSPADVDQVLVTEIYPAREAAPADGFSSRQIVAALQHPQVRLSGDLAATGELLATEAHPGDVVLVLSAGDADRVSTTLLAHLNAQQAQENNHA